MTSSRSWIYSDSPVVFEPCFLQQASTVSVDIILYPLPAAKQPHVDQLMKTKTSSTMCCCIFISRLFFPLSICFHEIPFWSCAIPPQYLAADHFLHTNVRLAWRMLQTWFCVTFPNQTNWAKIPAVKHGKANHLSRMLCLEQQLFYDSIILRIMQRKAHPLLVLFLRYFLLFFMEICFRCLIYHTSLVKKKSNQQWIWGHVLTLHRSSHSFTLFALQMEFNHQAFLRNRTHKK